MGKDINKRFESDKDSWESRYNNKTLRSKVFTTVSNQNIPPLSIPGEQGYEHFINKIGFPGAYPYTRGIYDTMYRGKLWTMRQFAGFGSPEDTNKRFKYLLQQGQTGLSTAFDMPVLMGYDCDSNMAIGEVGKEGVSISTIEDMDQLFDGIDISSVSTSMTVNATASIVLAMYLVVAERKGISWNKLRGTIQNDMLKEFIAQREWISPPESSVKIVIDMIEFCTKEVPLWNPVSISGYHIREAGSTAVQELAFTLADGIHYVEESINRGINVDSFAPRLSFFFNLHNDFFEEIAKLRAARRMWASIMKDRFGAKYPRSLMLRTHTQTAGCSLTAQQPMNNVVRVTIQALAGILGGTQSLHTNCMDETLSLPTEESVTLALRTQQIIAEESGVVNSIDPLGGSYFIEELTDEMEKEAYEYIKKIDEMGGIIKAIESAYPQIEIAEAAYVYQQQLDVEQKTVVGVNKYQSDELADIDLHRFDDSVEIHQINRLRKIKSTRNNKKVMKSLRELRGAAVDGKNLMPYIIDSVRGYATLGEISDVYRDVYGVYTDPGHY